MSEKAERLYERARALEPGTRASFVEEACRGDPQLREELVSLLERAEAADDFFDLLDQAVFSTPFSTGESQDQADPSGGVADLPTRSPYAELDVGEAVGRYQIQSLIGRGGMGMVYRAHDERLKRDVALKFLPPLSTRLDDEERLLREARAAAALEHPNVCSIHEVGETDDGRPFITMALCEGETLRERLRQGPLPVEDAVATAVQIARGLAAAHARGIVHRDIKPGNVMLGADGSVRILDFGLATATDATSIRSGMTPGTVAYMSPEQARGHPLDARTDLWSLGVVLYEMLTGVRPFRGEDELSLLQAVLHEDPGPVSMLRHEVSGPLARIVERLLQKDRGNRYGSTADLLTDLTEALSTEAPMRPRVVTRRRAALAGAFALVILVGAALWLPGSEEARLGDVKDGQLRRHQSSNVAAHELYLRGMDPTLVRSEDGAREAVGYFEQAIAIDSTYAAAYAELAVYYLRMGDARAEDTATKALTLDDSLGTAHWAMGRVRTAELDFAAAENEIRRAIALDPTDWRFRGWMSNLHIWAGRPAEALAEARRAHAIDPLSPYTNVRVAIALCANGRYDEALAQLESIATIQPPLQEFAATAGQCLVKKRRWAEAIAVLRPQAEAGDVWTNALLGHTLARAGQREEASRILADLLEHGSEAFPVAVVYAGLGDFDQAFAWLDKSIDDRSIASWVMGPTFDDLHRDPRFEELRKRLGLQKL